MGKISNLIFFQATVFLLLSGLFLALASYLFYIYLSAGKLPSLLGAVISAGLFISSAFSLYSILRRRKFSYYLGLSVLSVILIAAASGMIIDIFILLGAFPPGLLFVKSIFILALIIGFILLVFIMTSIMIQIKLKKELVF